MRLPILFVIVLLVWLVPASASAVTVDQIVALSKAGVSEPIILALIDRDKTVFTIDSDQLIALRRNGVSENVVLAMLKSGRQEGDEAARADSAATTSRIMSTLSPAPDLVIVGHGPDRPNTAHVDGFFSGPPVYFAPLPVPFLPYAAPYAIPYGSPYGSRLSPYLRRDEPPLERSQCLAQATSGPVRSNSPLAFVTDCPSTLQPRRSFLPPFTGR
jgi:hypothetical protein